MQQSQYLNGFNSSSSFISPPPAPALTSFIASPTGNAEAGPSTQTAPRKRNGISNAARKRRMSAAADSEESGASQRKARDRSKKKKAARACFHCQKAHLTCDDARPCQRCIKRGIADNCMEGQRKKAKYLLDEAELDALKSANTAKKAPSGNSETLQLATPEPFPGDPLFNLSFDPNFTFGSEAANLEYSILSAILGNPNHDNPHLPSNSQPNQTAFGQQFANAAWPAEPSQQQQQSISAQVIPDQQSALNTGLSSSQPGQFSGQQLFSDQHIGVQQIQHQHQPPPDFTSFPSTNVPFSSQQAPEQYSQPYPQSHSTHQQQQVTHGASIPVGHNASHVPSPLTIASPLSSHSFSENATSSSANQHSNESRMPLNVYDSVTKPYNYTESYHFLMKFLPTRFEKNDILRVVRALAIFRPSLIALQTPLSEEDEVFVEKCFQRSLTELDKLISFSGTPTVVWRRTGEICLVGSEFCLLTEWSKEELTSGPKYIYELFENQSVVEYWEKFASHAFENTTQSVFCHCVLLKPSGEPVHCTFCFSIRRDIFDLPSIVIGQWLPLL